MQELPELAELKKMFHSKYGGAFVKAAGNEVNAVEACQVSEKMVNCLSLQPPSDRSKFEAFITICEENGVKLDASATPEVRAGRRSLTNECPRRICWSQ